jgi:protein SCO1/2
VSDGRRRLSPGFVTLVAVALLVAGAAWAWQARQARRTLYATDGQVPAVAAMSSDQGLPILGEVPDFSLLSSDGTAITARDLEGAPWVANFIFTTCAGVCPLMSAQMARLQEELPDDSPVRLLSITVDPVRDTPEALQAYAERFNARPERWLFVTGEPQQIYALAKDGFHLGAGELPDYDPDRDDGPFFHSSRLALVDAQRRIRGYYEGAESAQVDRLQKDLAHLQE